MKLKLASYLLISSMLPRPSASSSAGISELAELIKTLLSIPDSLILSLGFLKLKAYADGDGANQDGGVGKRASKTANTNGQKRHHDHPISL